MRLAQGLCRSRHAVAALVFAVSACATPGQPVAPPEAEFPATPLQSSPQSATARGAPRALAVLPQTPEEGAAAQPIIVRGAAAPTPAPAAAPAGSPGAADVTFNFSGADIRDVIASVLGGTLKLNYVIDPERQRPRELHRQPPATP